MSTKNLVAKTVLLPCSKLYGAATWLRNKFFDWGILRQVEFDVPVIVVGNLSAGGTGKTPHVEYIVSALCHRYRIGVLSRGYKRGTKGFIMAGSNHSPRDIGDEAYQIFRKFNNRISVAVCENRVEGIRRLLELDPKINLIILDDAFQHRYVKPTIAIVIAEYKRPVYTDKLLPYGRLRESARGLNRADILIVSKCPQAMRPLDYRVEIKNYGLYPYQHLYFSRFAYQHLKPVFPDVASTVPYIDWLSESDSILAVAGIGNPRPFVRHLKSFSAVVKVDIFPDHHFFNRKDIEHITRRYNNLKGNNRIIVTTEKDAVRLANNPYFPYELKASTFYLPVEVDFAPTQTEALEQTIGKLLRQARTNR